MRRLPNLVSYEASDERFREAMSRILLSNLIGRWKSARNRLKAKDVTRKAVAVRTICYYYNIGSCLKDKSCKFHHACMRCLREGHTALDSDMGEQIQQPR